MREDVKNSLLIEAPVLILGLGLIAPLLANGTFRDNLFLGIVAIGTLAVSNVTIAAICPRLQKNARIGAAILIGGVVLTLVKIASAAIPAAASLSLETLVPILVVTAVMTADTEAFAAKKKISRALFDGCGIGLAFTLLLFFFGLARDLIVTTMMQKNFFDDGLRIVRFFETLPGVFFLTAIIVLGIGIISQRKKKGAL